MKPDEALEAAKQGLEVDPDSEDLKKLMAQIVQENEEDNKLPADHPERK